MTNLTSELNRYSLGFGMSKRERQMASQVIRYHSEWTTLVSDLALFVSASMKSEQLGDGG